MDYEEQYEGYTIQIENDTLPLSPREWDTLTTIYTEAKLPSEIDEVPDNPKICKPLYAYEHGGITISTSPFSCRWDSGQIGWVIITEEDQNRIGTPDDRLEEMLEAEIDTYDSYIRGEVYLYTVESPAGEMVDGCGGFYDKDQAIAEAKGMIEHFARQAREQKHNKLKALIDNDVPLNKRQKELEAV